jgi:hypothetical protein
MRHDIGKQCDGRLRSHWRVFQGQPVLWLSTSPRRCFSMRLFATSQNKPEITASKRGPGVPASRFIPSFPTTTQDELHNPHTSLSLPSFVHPHREAATASIADGLFEYVASLKVSRRERKDCSDEGRYSAEAGSVESWLNLNVNALLALVATRLRIAVRCGVLADSSGSVLLRKMVLGVDLVS